MKNNFIVAATALLGTATAGVHKMKLEKVPLEMQFVCESSESRKEMLTVVTERC